MLNPSDFTYIGSEHTINIADEYTGQLLQYRYTGGNQAGFEQMFCITERKAGFDSEVAQMLDWHRFCTFPVAASCKVLCAPDSKDLFILVRYRVPIQIPTQE